MIYDKRAHRPEDLPTFAGSYRRRPRPLHELVTGNTRLRPEPDGGQIAALEQRLHRAPEALSDEVDAPLVGMSLPKRFGACSGVVDLGGPFWLGFTRCLSGEEQITFPGESGLLTRWQALGAVMFIAMMNRNWFAKAWVVAVAVFSDLLSLPLKF